jgi:hypothetical protein
MMAGERPVETHRDGAHMTSPTLVILAAFACQGEPPATDTVRFCAPHSARNLLLHGFELEIPRASTQEGGLAGAPNVETMLDNGPTSNRVDLVFVGDGFTEGELGSWPGVVIEGYERLFEYEPFTRYRNYFNIHRVDVISNESGVDNDPTEGIDRDTALDMRFFCGNIERLLCIDVAKAQAQAAHAPDVDQIVAVANSSKYGGAGYSGNDLGTYSGFNSLSVEVFIHELGHALGDLADEYDYNDGTVYEGPERSEANASILSLEEMTGSGQKWDVWIGSDLAGVGTHGCFEGSVYSEFGAYRPSNNSMMRSLEQPFNSPSREQLIRKIYQLVSPIDDIEPTSGSVSLTETVSVVTPELIGATLRIAWYINGSMIDGANESTLDLATLPLSGGETLTVQVWDDTEMVRDEDLRATLMTDSRNWTVEGIQADVNGDGAVDGTDLSIILGFWGTSNSIADVNDDGIVDGTDLSLVLGYWG